MLLAVGGESRRIVLGEVPPVQSEQEQESAQDVAAQWLQSEGQESTLVCKVTGPGSNDPSTPLPQQRAERVEESRYHGIRNRKSRRRRVRVTGNHSFFMLRISSVFCTNIPDGPPYLYFHTYTIIVSNQNVHLLVPSTLVSAC